MTVTREVMVPNGLDSLDSAVEIARAAEDGGFDRAWVGENWGRDAVTILATIAASTDDIGIGTSIAPVYSRTPSLLGQSAATLQEAADGGFRMGVGPSSPAVIEHWHGTDFERPLRRTREYVEIIKTVVGGDVVEYDGEFFDLSGFRLRTDPPSPVPVDVAAIGPKMIELAGRFADGWHPVMLTPDGVEERYEHLQRGASLGDRSADDLRVTAGVICCVLEDGERARKLTRSHIAKYVGAMGTFYRDAIAEQGYEETATTVHELWQEGNHDEAKAAVGDDLVDDVAVAGGPDSVADRLARFDVDAIDAVNVHFPGGASHDDIEETLSAVASID